VPPHSLYQFDKRNLPDYDVYILCSYIFLLLMSLLFFMIRNFPHPHDTPPPQRGATSTTDLRQPGDIE
jgi:hypothetical protein